jgi:hypothetical protein
LSEKFGENYKKYVEKIEKIRNLSEPPKTKH